MSTTNKQELIFTLLQRLDAIEKKIQKIQETLEEAFIQEEEFSDEEESSNSEEELSEKSSFHSKGTYPNKRFC